jgi:hypothetical protein
VRAYQDFGERFSKTTGNTTRLLEDSFSSDDFFMDVNNLLGNMGENTNANA